MTILYEDNHIIIVNKASGEIVQGDKTGDATLIDTTKLYLKKKYHKPGDVFLGTVHRLDRPVSGIVIYAKTSKALSRLNELFRKGEIHKTYHAILPYSSHLTYQLNDQFQEIRHYLTRNERQNKAYAHNHEITHSKLAILEVKRLQKKDRLQLAEIKLHTGRHHQIRCQLSALGLPIRGDLKYGAARSNPDGSICLHAQSIKFVHPVSKQKISITAPYPKLSIWQLFE